MAVGCATRRPERKSQNTYRLKGERTAARCFSKLRIIPVPSDLYKSAAVRANWACKGLASPAESIIVSWMLKSWKIVISTERVGGGPRIVEYFLVAFPDEVAALMALRQRRPDLIGGDFRVDGEASSEFVEWLNMEDGQILNITIVS